jgi:hypothetical protein
LLAQTHDERPKPESEAEMNYFLEDDFRRALANLNHQLDWRKLYNDTSLIKVLT